jgi:serine/threonine protein kinase
MSGRQPLPPPANVPSGPGEAPIAETATRPLLFGAGDPARHRQFNIHYCLGRGGYGEVYRATMTSPGNLRAEVALKLLRMDVATHDDAVRRLRDEGRMLGLLQHPAILKVYDLAALEGRVGLVTEFVDGADLAAVSHELPLRATLEVIAAVAEGLDAAWDHVPSEGQAPLRLVHRDIKPSNLRLGRHGEVKILDFGIARSTTESADRESRTGTGSALGSLAYMAPERFTRAPPSPASDVHALGCVLYEALAGRRLFEDPVPVEMFRLAADPIAYEEHLEAAWKRLPGDLPPGVSNLLAAMIAHAPADRPSAKEVRPLAEALAEQAAGPSLRAWARDFAWPRPQTVPGVLDGRTIAEGSGPQLRDPTTYPPEDERSSDTFRIEVPGHTPPAVAPRPPTPPAVEERRSRMPIAIAGVGVVLLAFAIGAWVSGEARLPAPSRPPATARARARPTPPPAPAPPPVPPAMERLVASPPDAPAPVAPAPPPRPSGSTSVQARSVPDPAPAAAPPSLPPPAPRSGTVRVFDRPAAIELRRDGRTFSVDGPIEAAPNYELWVDFGTGLRKQAAYVPVQADLVTTLRCLSLTYTCNVD